MASYSTQPDCELRGAVEGLTVNNHVSEIPLLTFQPSVPLAQHVRILHSLKETWRLAFMHVLSHTACLLVFPFCR